MTSGIRAHVSLGALRVNLRAVLSTTRAGIIDVRADAWGHGIGEVARVALEAGAASLLVDRPGADALRATVAPERLVMDAEATAPAAVYGLTPGFTPVLSLRGHVLSLKGLRAGEGVSYGYTHHASNDTVVALVTGGYAQGVVRALGNSADVVIDGSRHPIVGRVAMDVCVVDVGATPVTPGQEVVFFGAPVHGPELSEWTAATGLSAAEIVSAIGLRAERKYVS